MRNTSKATLSVITLGILAGSFQAGLATSTAKQNLAESLSASGQTSSGGNSSSASNSSATSSGSSSSSQNSAVSGSASVAEQTPTQAPTPTPKATASSPTPSATTPANQNNSSSSSTSGSKTATSEAIYYRYGTIQLEVVKSGKTITAINLVQASTRGRQYEVVPPMLVTAALSAQGTNFANVSGATFTSEAFRSALESALGKL